MGGVAAVRGFGVPRNTLKDWVSKCVRLGPGFTQPRDMKLSVDFRRASMITCVQALGLTGTRERFCFFGRLPWRRTAGVILHMPPWLLRLSARFCDLRGF